MKTKKQNLLAVAVLMAAIMGGSQPAVASTDSTTVSITGVVNDSTCTVGDKAEGLLDSVSVRDFAQTAGKVLGSVEVPIVFSGCGVNTKGVTVKVSGTAAGSEGAFRNENEANNVGGAAKNVGVYFYDTDDSIIQAGTDIAAKEQSFTVDTTLHYHASYVAITDSVEAGTVLTTITMSFTYQ